VYWKNAVKIFFGEVESMRMTDSIIRVSMTWVNGAAFKVYYVYWKISVPTIETPHTYHFAVVQLLRICESKPVTK
jgi:hypothetical protein